MYVVTHLSECVCVCVHVHTMCESLTSASCSRCAKPPSVQEWQSVKPLISSHSNQDHTSSMYVFFILLYLISLLFHICLAHYVIKDINVLMEPRFNVEALKSYFFLLSRDVKIKMQRGQICEEKVRLYLCTYNCACLTV